VNPPNAGRSRRRSPYRRLPPWLQWALPFAVAGVVVGGLIWYVNHQTYDVPQIANVTKPSAVAAQDQQGTVIVKQQQAPHESRIRAGQTAIAGVHAAVLHYMNHEIALGVFDGPVTRSACTQTGGSGSRLVFHCTVTATSQVVTYPFDAVADPASGVITYCQRVEPPIPSMNIPVSKRCT
jgi:hypothetical protein